MEVSTTGLQCDGSPLLPSLCMGVIIPAFTHSGVTPVSRDSLQRWWSAGAKAVAHSFIMITGIPSGPAEDEVHWLFMASLKQGW